jgi:hypothetical protein
MTNMKATALTGEAMKTIVEQLKELIVEGTMIPKPRARADFIVKGWGKRRDEDALIYTIPNRNDPNRPYKKGITVSEWEIAFKQLTSTGEFSRKWFEQQMPACAEEGGCNFTTIGGISTRLGYADYHRGVYRKKAPGT